LQSLACYGPSLSFWFGESDAQICTHVSSACNVK
jgi:hypothetical protein